MTLKTKGSVERVDLGELTGQPVLAGLVLAARHEGPGIVRRWGQLQQRWRLQEARAVRQLLADMGEDLLREVYGDQLEALEQLRLAQVAELEAAGRQVPPVLQEPIPLHRAIQTPEGQEAFVGLQREVVGQVACELGVLVEGAAIAEELERLGALGASFRWVQEVQSLTAPQFPAPAGAGDDGPGAGVALGSGVGSAGGTGP